MLKLIELNNKMGRAEYDMYQDIPPKESGSTNLCKGLSFDVFANYIESQVARKYQKISFYDTPAITYIMYDIKKPVGYVCIRTKINKQWKDWCGNIYYAVRQSERRKGYGTKMLKLALDECRNLGMKTVFVKAAEGNIASQKVIENNGGIFIKAAGSRFYKIVL